jgi:peptidoglycan/xylan/chitin deacetylase (PgdA/CDA1 family)
MPAKLRRFFHIAAANMLHYSGTLVLWRLFRQNVLHRDQVCVLGLHRVLTNTERSLTNSLDGMILGDDTYVELLEYLQRRFHVISLDAFLAQVGPKSTNSKPICLVTFDDGWIDTYSTAFPTLRKLGLPAVVFLATDSIGTRGGFWVEGVKRAWGTTAFREQMKTALSDLRGAKAAVHADLVEAIEWLKHMPTEKRNTILERIGPAEQSGDGYDEVDSMLSWEQALEMSNAGIEMGAHSVSHPLLSYEEDAAVERELRLSRQALEARLGKQVRAFAYPNGDWNERVRKQVEQAGYQCAFTTSATWYSRKENPYTIPRVLLHEGNVTGSNGKFSVAMLNLTLAGWA